MNDIQSLEVKIPPPFVAALIIIAMWGISNLLPSLPLPNAVRIYTAIAIVLLGGFFGLAGIISFYQAETTINPMKPETASSLVSSGIYRITRNPMYVGLLLDLVAYAVFLSSAWALLGPISFFAYISRFQVAPEERALEKLFGQEYSSYKLRVRRWL
jgi:protein-S-isoprenylcysteine O-methyltransferase Ste14